MNFFKKYWYLLTVTLITIGIGVVAYLTSTKLETRQPVAPTVPQVTPKATDINCKLVFSLATDETPTPTNTAGPTPTNTQGPTPTNTASPTPTPTGVSDNTRPECTDLTIEPATGTPPYTVTLTCAGRDTDGDITAAEFTLPDGSTKLVEENVGSPGSLSTTYTVTSAGANSFSCQVRDNNNVWVSSNDCRIGVAPTLPPGTTATPTLAPGTTATPTPIQTPKIPVAGIPSILGASVIGGGLLLLLLGLVL